MFVFGLSWMCRLYSLDEAPVRVNVVIRVARVARGTNRGLGFSKARRLTRVLGVARKNSFFRAMCPRDSRALQFVAKMLYGISTQDPLTLAAVSAGLAAVAVVAGWIPARRACAWIRWWRCDGNEGDIASLGAQCPRQSSTGLHPPGSNSLIAVAVSAVVFPKSLSSNTPS